MAIRRWESFPRRNKRKIATDDHKVLDLAKGLKAHFDKENHDHLVEYEVLARVLAKILAKQSPN